MKCDLKSTATRAQWIFGFVRSLGNRLQETEMPLMEKQMRKYIKKDLCNIIEQLASVNETLINKGKGVSQEQVQEILTDCQQGAVDVGNKIEEIEGEGTEAVRLLEEYCEKVYLLCVNWPDEKLRDKELKNIRVLLNKVKNSILYDIKDSKKEVVFLPYKASMWDSLESVWKAADEDPECDAYVIPIPYYDKNPDGSFKEMHYEGELYPKYVPITDWQAYDLEKNHPDVIFIHNPYDGGNHVTSVHPFFYSKNIKKFTEKLVYIPYFVLEEAESKNKAFVEKVSHFVLNSGVINSDVTIVQSKAMREIYIDVLLKQFDREKLSESAKKTIENKILAIGSPKFDKVHLLDKKDYPLPQEWAELIGGKKVVMFNNSIPQVLVHKEAFLDKLESVLAYFKEQDDYVLWWRPHPLIDASIESMRPQLAERYKQIVNDYCDAQYGIYDNTADLYRAIAWSDRYFGAKSSVIWLYGLTGKPLMTVSTGVGIRKNFDIENWYTSDIEENDLKDWLYGLEKWKLKKTIFEMFPKENYDGQIGARIYKSL